MITEFDSIFHENGFIFVNEFNSDIKRKNAIENAGRHLTGRHDFNTKKKKGDKGSPTNNINTTSALSQGIKRGKLSNKQYTSDNKRTADKVNKDITKSANASDKSFRYGRKAGQKTEKAISKAKLSESSIMESIELI